MISLLINRHKDPFPYIKLSPVLEVIYRKMHKYALSRGICKKDIFRRP